MLDFIQLDTGPHPRWAMIWLHGLGASGHDLSPLIDELTLPHWPALRCIFPHAPLRALTVNGGLQLPGWYDIVSTDLTHGVDRSGIMASVSQVQQLINTVGRQGFSPHRLFIAGFSQGGVIALHTGIRHADPLAGMIGLSTYLPDLADTDHPTAAIASNQRVFLGHGLNDPIVPLSLGQDAAQWLRDRHYLLHWETFSMGHHICPEEILAIQQWLEPCFQNNA